MELAIQIFQFPVNINIMIHSRDLIPGYESTRYLSKYGFSPTNLDASRVDMFRKISSTGWPRVQLEGLNKYWFSPTSLVPGQV